VQQFVALKRQPKNIEFFDIVQIPFGKISNAV